MLFHARKKEEFWFQQYFARSPGVIRRMTAYSPLFNHSKPVIRYTYCMCPYCTCLENTSNHGLKLRNLLSLIIF